MSTTLALGDPKWKRSGAAHARGQGFDASGNLLQAGALAALFSTLADPDECARTVSSINGSFAVVRTDGYITFAAVDRLRSIPLFFAGTDDELLIADAAGAAADGLSRANANVLAAKEFRFTGYVTGSETLLQDVSQIPASHFMYHVGGDSRPSVLQAYYRFLHDKPNTGLNDEQAVSKLVSVHEQVFTRLVRDIGNRQIVVPLSGGYDSRLIGVMLRDLGCRNVLCYTYGVTGNWEAKISRELAAYLGFSWNMIPYSSQRWHTWARTPEFEEYFRDAGNFSAVPHFQDWPAVYELRKQGLLSTDAVFVPGHSGDFLAGSHLPLWFASRHTIARNELLQALFDAHYSLWPWPRRAAREREIFSARIEQVVGKLTDVSAEQAGSLFEYWDCQERQAKFIVNSVRAYEFFGYDWRLPLFDHELMDFWSQIPLAGRISRRLYFKFVRKHQNLPVTAANADRPAPLANIISLAKRSPFWSSAKAAQRLWRKLHWQQRYEGSDAMGWLALIDREQFRRLYSGREIGHSFFALKYLDTVAQRGGA